MDAEDGRGSACNRPDPMDREAWTYGYGQPYATEGGSNSPPSKGKAYRPPFGLKTPSFRSFYLQRLRWDSDAPVGLLSAETPPRFPPNRNTKGRFETQQRGRVSSGSNRSAVVGVSLRRGGGGTKRS